MTRQEFDSLQCGDIVRPRPSVTTNVFTVSQRFDGRKTVVRTEEITNPEEWVLVSKASYILEKNPD